MKSSVHHPLVRLARASIETYVCEGRIITFADLPQPISGDPAGVFVTLHLRSTGELRGCIGTICPTEATLAQETILNGIAAATRDPRFPPVSSEELPDLVIDVSVLQTPERIDCLEQLDPQVYGVIVERERRRGLLLPAIPGIDDAQTQVDLAKQKAWLDPDEPCDLYRFRVDKYT